MMPTGKNNTEQSIHQVKRALLQIFVDRDISTLSENDAALIQRVIGNLVNPSALSRQAPKDEDYRRALRILQRTPTKKDSTPPLPDTGFSLAEISLVLQGLDSVEMKPDEAELFRRMREVLKAMAAGNTRVWHNLSHSLEPIDISVYGFLRDMLQRARNPESARMASAPKKRSQKRFWDGGVDI